MNAQAGIIIALLTALVVIQLWAQFPALAGTTEVKAAPPPAFSVTSTGENQYVLRANDNIFFCVNNRCTTIQLITVPQGGAATRAPAPAEP